jgi:hypothetical protein
MINSDQSVLVYLESSNDLEMPIQFDQNCKLIQTRVVTLDFLAHLFHAGTPICTPSSLSPQGRLCLGRQFDAFLCHISSEQTFQASLALIQNEEHALISLHPGRPPWSSIESFAPFRLDLAVMDDTDTLSLARLAGKISDCASEAVTITDDLYNASNDPALEAVHKDYSCFTEACGVLSRELGKFDVAESDWDHRF